MAKHIAIWEVDGERHLVPARKSIAHRSLKLAERALMRRGDRFSRNTRGLIYTVPMNTDDHPVLTIAL